MTDDGMDELDDDDALFEDITEADYEEVVDSSPAINSKENFTEILFSSFVRKFFLTWAYGSIVNKTLTANIEHVLMFDILDEMSGGKLSRQLEFKKLERDYASTVRVTKFITKLDEQMIESEDHIAENARVYMSSLKELMDFKMDRVEAEYLEKCEELGVEDPREAIAQDKLYTDSPYEKRITRYVPLILRESEDSTEE
jgi:hypothetical protein